MELNELIKIRRRELGLTLKDVAQKLGVAESTVLRYERKDIRRIGIDKIAALADVLHCSPGRLLGWAPDLLPAADKAGTDGVIADKTVTINVYASLPASLPCDGIADVTGTLQIPATWLADGDTYIAVTVTELSMYPRYLEGDTVIVKVSPDCPKGHDALVAVDGAPLLRQVDYDPDGTLTLKAYNPEYPPKNFGPKDERVTILGIVREMRRNIAIP